MACPQCHRRSTLLAALAPAIERTTPLTRQTLLALLALKDDEQLRHAARGANPSKLHHKTAPPPTPGAPTTLGLASRTEPPATAHAADNASRETCRHDDAYPRALAQLDSAPAVLHTTCNKARLTELLAQPTVALIGDRHHTNYGHQAMWALARDLATAGITIISGLHQGIDGIAHHGALHAGGRTIAVTGSAPDTRTPANSSTYTTTSRHAARSRPSSHQASTHPAGGASSPANASSPPSPTQRSSSRQANARAPCSPPRSPPTSARRWRSSPAA